MAFCVLGCFSGSGFEAFCGLRLLGLGAGLAAAFVGCLLSLAGLLLFAAKLGAAPLCFGTAWQIICSIGKVKVFSQLT